MPARCAIFRTVANTIPVGLFCERRRGRDVPYSTAELATTYAVTHSMRQLSTCILKCYLILQSCDWSYYYSRYDVYQSVDVPSHK